MTTKPKVVLAFSGGLDTSYCAIYLRETLGYEVHTALVNTGGFSAAELQEIADKAQNLGVASHITLHETQRYYENCLKYLIFGNILKNNTYPLSVSSERMFQAIGVAEYARQIGASAIAHGSTGAGNDQVRFDLAFQILAPEIKILTPIRDQKLSRQAEIEFLQKNGIAGNWEKAAYSINKGLWGTSVGGKETLSSHQALPEAAFPSQLQASDYQLITLHFEKGEICGINDQRYTNAIEAIQVLNELGAKYAIGRDTHVGDTIIGIKGRVGFEAPAALLIIKAHHLLEKHTLTKWQMYWKEQLANWYGMMLHEALYLDPVMRNIEQFLTDTQARVSGKVMLKLLPYRFELEGIESPYDMMQAKFGSYGEMNNAWSGEDVKGFTSILANQLKIYESLKD
ncbi:MAG: argininosuccinate synthase [Microscillaceae bacterium]|nr:argininosuccinate synthase [Microscillaceae bacterium]